MLRKHTFHEDAGGAHPMSPPAGQARPAISITVSDADRIKERAPTRRYTGDRRSPKPFGRITQDTRVILASFSIRYAEMITRVSVDRRDMANVLGLVVAAAKQAICAQPPAHAPRSRFGAPQPPGTPAIQQDRGGNPRRRKPVSVPVGRHLWEQPRAARR